MKYYVLIRDFREDKITLHERESKDSDNLWTTIENKMANSECQAWILTSEQLTKLRELIGDNRLSIALDIMTDDQVDEFIEATNWQRRCDETTDL